ncbi:hypothetical protein CAPTEDRAFT_193243 [Capitella teleta]|uniref:Uncharacterized protein n=1 Tax=Capitella teleta TaxID=283909 RepID=R7UHV5_CAPTE|nr:hypothetical protein CAPTEDRAFT_193243 [Capitella teleta]|eukprot:ELU05795.1 hypothetical protein CAPTEDRAFT_193243 [Capitella teleta]
MSKSRIAARGYSNRVVLAPEEIPLTTVRTLSGETDTDTDTEGSPRHLLGPHAAHNDTSYIPNKAPWRMGRIEDRLMSCILYAQILGLPRPECGEIDTLFHLFMGDMDTSDGGSYDSC